MPKKKSKSPWRKFSLKPNLSQEERDAKAEYYERRRMIWRGWLTNEIKTKKMIGDIKYGVMDEESKR